MLSKLRQAFREFVCAHRSLRHKRDFLGAEIERHHWYQSEWECQACGKTILRQYPRQGYDPATGAELE